MDLNKQLKISELHFADILLAVFSFLLELRKT